MTAEASHATGSREQTSTSSTPPRFSAPEGSLAAAAARRADRLIPSILDYKTASGVLIEATDARESARTILDEAASLLSVIACGYDDAMKHWPREGSEFEAIRPSIKARALEGVARLIGLADYAVAVSQEVES